MKVCTGLAIIVALVVGLAVPGPVSAKPAGDDAFLIESADSVESLVAQVEDSRLLVLRYAKHFKADPASVLAYFRNEISIDSLEEDVSVTVYKRKGTDVEAENRVFKAGTRVFVNSNGIPVMELGSGNPITDSLPGKDVKKMPSKPSTIEDMKATSSTPAEQSAATTQPGQPPVQTAQLPGDLPATVPGAETAPLGTPANPEVAVLSSGPIETVGRVVTGAAGGGLPAWVLPAAGIAGAAMLVGGNGSGAPASPAGNGGELPNAVPEPAGLVALGAGAVSLAGVLHRRRMLR